MFFHLVGILVMQPVLVTDVPQGMMCFPLGMMYVSPEMMNVPQGMMRNALEMMFLGILRLDL